MTPARVALDGSLYFKLPKVLQWFSGNIGLHHIHHARPTIPNYNLQQLCDDVQAFQAVEPLTLRTSFTPLRIGVSTMKNRKMISFQTR